MNETEIPETVFSEDKPHAKCLGCDKILITPQDLSEHFKETTTVGGGRSHRARIVNQTRDQEVDSLISREIDRALERFYERMEDEIRGGRLTTQEVKQSLRYYSDFADGWDEWVRESYE